MHRLHAMAGLLFMAVIRPALHAAPLELAQSPGGASYRAPAPNVILSVDNTASMDTRDMVDRPDDPHAVPMTRLQAVKASLAQVLHPDRMADGRLRLAWQSASPCSHVPCLLALHPMGAGLQPDSARSRVAFMRWLDGLASDPQARPPKQMLRNAGEFLRKTGVASAWSDRPGTAQPLHTLKPCRRAFHVLVTDSASMHAPSAFQPIQAFTLPDGTLFDPETNAQLRPYTGHHAAPLADLAFHYWATDLQPDIPDEVPPTHVRTQSRHFLASTSNASGLLGTYWYPRNDPARWQHMVTHVVGIGPDVLWSAPPRYRESAIPEDEPASLLAGSLTWLDPAQSTEGARQELLRTAINSRGHYVQSGQSREQLQAVLGQLLSSMLSDHRSSVSGFYGMRGAMLQDGLRGYAASYETQDWTGYVYAGRLAPHSASGDPDPAWGTHDERPALRFMTTADKLDARRDIAQRLVLTHDGERGIPFRWHADGRTSLSAEQQAQLLAGSNDSANGPRLVDYLRGDRSLEASGQRAGLRPRKSRQGDIINSQLWRVGPPGEDHVAAGYARFASTHAQRTPMLYVGGNDGMLHGFSAENGEELMAYVPRGVMAHLHLLADHNYRHRYFVDGSPFSADANLGTEQAPDWRTLLVGTLAAGGRGFFVLDVTRPSPQQDFREDRAGQVVVMDRTADADPDIGHIFAAPTLDDTGSGRATQITRTNNGRWALILGNGYNSPNERPVLLIQYLDGARELKKISPFEEPQDGPGAQPPHHTSANGLSAPRLLDVNGDGIPDVVYAGDLHGHLWKFDIGAASDAQWGVALGGQPLYTAHHQGRPQPITTAPLLRPHTEIGALIVAFGTGRELTEDDRIDENVQTLYAIADYTRYTLQRDANGQVSVQAAPADASRPFSARSRAQLMEQSIASDAGSDQGRHFWTLHDTSVRYCTSEPCAPDERKGWYFDLPVPRERVLSHMRFYGDSNILEVISRVPAYAGGAGAHGDETCHGELHSGQNYRTLIHLLSGSRPASQIMDTDGDGLFTEDDEHASRSTAAEHELRFRSGSKQLRRGSDGRTDVYADVPRVLRRASWHHLQ